MIRITPGGQPGKLRRALARLTRPTRVAYEHQLASGYLHLARRYARGPRPRGARPLEALEPELQELIRAINAVPLPRQPRLRHLDIRTEPYRLALAHARREVGALLQEFVAKFEQKTWFLLLPDTAFTVELLDCSLERERLEGALRFAMPGVASFTARLRLARGFTPRPWPFERYVLTFADVQVASGRRYPRLSYEEMRELFGVGEEEGR
jgi:hypothetical protein